MKKKSLIDNLKATKKANIATAPAKNEGTSTRKFARRAELGRRARVIN